MLAIRIRKESYTVDYAGFWVRFFAFLIDALILVGIVWLYNGIWGLASGTGFFGEEAVDVSLPGAVIGSGSSYWALSSAILFLILVAYFICFWGWRGQTPGKMVMRISIVHFDGTQIGWGGAVNSGAIETDYSYPHNHFTGGLATPSPETDKVGDHHQKQDNAAQSPER